LKVVCELQYIAKYQVSLETKKNPCAMSLLGWAWRNGVSLIFAAGRPAII
jgi:hypothetical protein